MADFCLTSSSGQEPSSALDSALCAIVERFETAWHEANKHPPRDRPIPSGGRRRAAPCSPRRAGADRPGVPLARDRASDTSRPSLPGTQPRPLLLNDYLARYPELILAGLVPVSLVGQEYRVRRRWGDSPPHRGIPGPISRSTRGLAPELKRLDVELAILEASGPACDADTRVKKGSGPYGRYRLERVVGYGGIGRVWLAYDLELNREVAIKEIRPERFGLGEERARFLVEAEITARLQHPGVVPVHELSYRSDTNQAFYVMPVHPRRTLTESINVSHDDNAAGKLGTLKLADLVQRP